MRQRRHDAVAVEELEPILRSAVTGRPVPSAGVAGVKEGGIRGDLHIERYRASLVGTAAAAIAALRCATRCVAPGCGAACASRLCGVHRFVVRAGNETSKHDECANYGGGLHWFGTHPMVSSVVIACCRELREAAWRGGRRSGRRARTRMANIPPSMHREVLWWRFAPGLVRRAAPGCPTSRGSRRKSYSSSLRTRSRT